MSVSLTFDEKKIQTHSSIIVTQSIDSPFIKAVVNLKTPEALSNGKKVIIQYNDWNVFEGVSVNASFLKNTCTLTAVSSQALEKPLTINYRSESVKRIIEDVLKQCGISNATLDFTDKDVPHFCLHGTALCILQNLTQTLETKTALFFDANAKLIITDKKKTTVRKRFSAKNIIRLKSNTIEVLPEQITCGDVLSINGDSKRVIFTRFELSREKRLRMCFDDL